jgi:hypothetical protein
LQNGNKNHFELLKQKIVATMKQSFPGINPSISEWKGQEITDFQEELLKKVNAHISEKWFYNHIKSENRSLPRIDVLNLLSKYAGYANWDDFVFRNTDPTAQAKSIPKANRYFIIVPLLVLVVAIMLFILFKLISNREYKISFYDAHTREVITGRPIEIQLLSDDESPVNYLTDSTGSLTLKTDERIIKIVVNAPYYKNDTIVRVLKSFERDQNISLQPNDYALIIAYFSQMKVDDWQKRRTSLDRMIDDNAMIYQVLQDENGPGMELYNKEEFIDRLTLPTGSLKNIEILDTKYKNEKIMILRFRINEKTK